MGRKQGSKVKKGTTKKKELLKFLDYVRSQFGVFEQRLNNTTDNVCGRVNKMYADKLKSLPENVRKMTLAEYLAFQEKSIQDENKENNKSIQSEFQKSKILSETKKALKSIRREERKRSVSASVASSSKSKPSSALAFRMSKVLSDSQLCTPLTKRSVAPSFVVTPKFNPKVPIHEKYLRRPKPGEILMSLSGSPLQNLVGYISERPGVAVSLGDGKIIKITGDTEISKLGNDFAKQLNEDTKQTLENVKRKLDEILKV